MSTRTIVACDRCEAEITEDRTALDVRCGPLLKTANIVFDVCPVCLRGFLEWFKATGAVIKLDEKKLLP